MRHSAVDHVTSSNLHEVDAISALMLALSLED